MGVAITWAVVLKILMLANFNQTPLLLIASFFGIAGLILFMMGFVAELVLRAYYETNNSTPYLIASTEEN